MSENRAKAFLDWIFAVRWRALLALGLIVFFCAVAGFYAVENGKGRRAWEEALAMLEAEGETDDFFTLAPEPIPEEENFGAIPFMRDIGVIEGDDPEAGVPGEKRRRLSEVRDRADYDAREEPAPDAGRGHETGVACNLEAWRQYYVDVEFLAEAEGEAEAEAEAEAGPGMSAATAMALVFAKHEELWRELEEGWERPRCQFVPTVHELAVGRQLFNVSLNHYNGFTTAIKGLRFRALAAGRLGDGETARKSLAIYFRWVDGLGADGLLIGQLVAITQHAVMLSAIWDLLAGRSLPESDLAWLEGELGRIDLADGYLRACRSELGFMSDSYEKANREEWLGLVQSMPIDLGGPDGLDELVSSAVVSLAPEGWWFQNRATMARWMLDYLIKPLKEGGFPAMRVREKRFLATVTAARLNQDPYAYIPAIGIPVLAKIGRRGEYAQVKLDQAAAACALERFFLEHRRYPDALGELVPDYLKEAPVDLMDGQEMRYRLDERNGRYELWSIGFDGVDDGGDRNLDPERPNKTRMYAEGFAGDWVWGYPEVVVAE